MMQGKGKEIKNDLQRTSISQMRMFRCYPIERSMDDRVRHLKRHFTSTEYAPLQKELISNNDVQNK